MWNEVIVICTILITASGGFLGKGMAASIQMNVF